ncbi:MAG: TonB-dependent receptor, partial [Polyangiaceae bacterium]|nr:TonB-dependent receptor [Polyangiaceae bacterium]
MFLASVSGLKPSRTAFAQPPVPLSEDLAAEESPEDAETEAYAEMSLEELLSIQVVTSASRRAQSMHEAPSSVSLLTFEDIENTRGLNLGHAFRRLLGVYVFQQTPNSTQVIVRNPVSGTNNEVLVLMDGRNAVEPVFGYSPWTWLPLMPEELESAEVIRGPGSVLYGANATGGVISLRTRRPLDHPGLEGRIRAGLAFVADDGEDPDDANRVATTGLGHVAYNYANDARTFGMRFSLGARNIPDTAPLNTVPTHGQYGYYALVGVESRPSSDVSIYATASHSEIEYIDPELALFLQSSTRLSEDAANLNYEHGGLLDGHLTLHANVDFTRQKAAGNDEQTDQSRYIAHGRVQGDLSVWEGRNVTSLGAEVSHLESQISGTSPSATTVSVTLQDELRLLDEKLLLSAAGRFDNIAYHTGLASDPDVDYRNPTARGSIVYRFVPEQDVRLTVATAFRTPLPFESSIGAAIPTDPPFVVVRPNPALKATVNQMMELGYRGDLFDHLRAEAVLSLTRIRRPTFMQPGTTLPFVIINGAPQHVIQGELGITGIIRQGTEVYANYVVTRSRAEAPETDPLQVRIPHRLSVGGNARFDNGMYVQGDVQMFWNLHTAPPTSFITPSNGRQDVPDLYEVNARVGRVVLDGR